MKRTDSVDGFAGGDGVGRLVLSSPVYFDCSTTRFDLFSIVIFHLVD